VLDLLDGRRCDRLKPGQPTRLRPSHRAATHHEAIARGAARLIQIDRAVEVLEQLIAVPPGAPKTEGQKIVTEHL
jgi:hypothetical protein